MAAFALKADVDVCNGYQPCYVLFMVTAQHVWMLWWQATGIHPRHILAIN